MDKYNKLQKIGQGSFGSAYLVTKKQDPFQKKYVLKEIRMDPRDQESALREARLLAALDHPNIIACKESFLSSPLQLCIVTDYADGGDLRKALTQSQTSNRTFREYEVLDIFIQVCLALKHLHDRKIIHRDIKPENIFLTKNQVVKLGDFGVATVLSHTLACAQTLTGTPYYTSPEICLGNTYNSKTDVWSLGCVLYELMTFTHAFNGRSQRQLFENIIKANITPISPSSGYSAPLIALVSEMLAKHPRNRPSINQIIKKPILMQRIQGFLVERNVREELNHTVLHGQHIFQKKTKAMAVATPTKQQLKKKTEVSPVLRIAPPPAPVSAPKPVLARKPAVPLKSPAPVAAVRKPVSAGIRKEAARAAASPRHKPSNGAGNAIKQPRTTATPQLTEQQRRLVERKKLMNNKAREKARAHQQLVVKSAASAAAAPQVLPPPPPIAASPSSAQPIADRIAAFNAQWHAQRQLLLNNISSVHPSSPPPPYSVSPAENVIADRHQPLPSTPQASPSVAAPSSAVIRRGKKPTSAAALAAVKQREDMRRDITERKRAIAKSKKRAVSSSSTPSPLDDPVILVQNLPDYKSKKPLAAPAQSQQSELESVLEAVETLEQESSSEPPTPDPYDDRSNIEFQRMLLQLKCVVDEPNDVEDDEDEGVEENVAAVVQPLESISSSDLPKIPNNLPIHVLENSTFRLALQARIQGEKEVITVPHEQQQTLDWMYHYISTLDIPFLGKQN